jgi:hypothetical protein
MLATGLGARGATKPSPEASERLFAGVILGLEFSIAARR